MKNSAPVPESGPWELLLVGCFYSLLLRCLGATARTELKMHFSSVVLPGVNWLFVSGVPFLQGR